MPFLKDDNSLPAIVWRWRTNNGKIDLKAMKGENEIQGSFRTNPSFNYMQPTEVGLRVGVPDNQTLDIAYLQPQQLNPYPTSKSPFFNNKLPDPFSTGSANEMAGSNEEINKLSSIGGQVLPIALDVDELPARMQAEYIRTDSKNPLSQSFAIQAAREQDQDPLKGPLTDIMRYDVKEDFEDQSITKRKVALGFMQEGVLGEEKYKRYKREVESSRDITSQDVQDFKDLFLRQVGNMGSQGKSVQQTLDNISNKMNQFSYPGDKVESKKKSRRTKNPRITISLGKKTPKMAETQTNQTPAMGMQAQMTVAQTPKKETKQLPVMGMGSQMAVRTDALQRSQIRKIPLLGSTRARTSVSMNEGPDLS